MSRQRMSGDKKGEFVLENFLCAAGGGLEKVRLPERGKLSRVRLVVPGPPVKVREAGDWSSPWAVGASP